MVWIRDLVLEWQARRRGARFVSRDIQRAARHIGGPTGNLFSNGWDRLEEGQRAYLQSFDPRVPPSIHISQRDLTRANLPIPLVERCIEDWEKTATPELNGNPDE